jgi:hypothetical protein
MTMKMPKIAPWVYGPRQERPAAAVFRSMGPWVHLTHPSPVFDEVCTLGDLAIVKRAKKTDYELYTPSHLLPCSWGSLEAMRAKGEELWARRTQQDLDEPQGAPSDREVDVQISDHSSVILFLPVTYDGQEWLRENVDPDAQWFGQALVVDHCYASDLIEGMAESGLSVGP